MLTNVCQFNVFHHHKTYNSSKDLNQTLRHIIVMIKYLDGQVTQWATNTSRCFLHITPPPECPAHLPPPRRPPSRTGTGRRWRRRRPRPATRRSPFSAWCRRDGAGVEGEDGPCFQDRHLSATDRRAPARPSAGAAACRAAGVSGRSHPTERLHHTRQSDYITPDRATTSHPTEGLHHTWRRDYITPDRETTYITPDGETTSHSTERLHHTR